MSAVDLGNKVSNPIRHHYVPVFYLKRWAGPDGRIIEFSRPYREVKPRRTFPAGTGFEERLYDAPAFTDQRRYHYESVFLHGVDTRAADALKMLEERRTNWTTETRSAWTRFIISLLIRTPADIAAIRADYIERWRTTSLQATAPEEEIYRNARGPNDPENFREFIIQLAPEALATFALGVFARIHNLAGMGERINSMDWTVVGTPASCNRFLTSDRAVYVSALGQRPAHVTLPIGPHQLFVAYDRGFNLGAINRVVPRELVRSVNLATVSNACKLVFGRDASCLPFVRENFSRTPQASMFTRAHRQAESLA